MIAYMPFDTAEESRAYDEIMARANLIVQTIDDPAQRLKRQRRYQFRKDIIDGKASVPGVWREAVLRLEQVKFRIMQAYIAKAYYVARQKLKMAKFYGAVEEQHGLLKDLRAEAVVAMQLAIYNYDDTSKPFMAYLTTVLNNHLGDYCASNSIVPMDNVTEFVDLYHEQRHEFKRRSGREPKFEEVVPLMATAEIVSEGGSPDEEGIERWVRKNASRYAALRSVVTGRAGGAVLFTVARRGDQDEVDQRDSLDGLTPLQKACMVARRDRVSFGEIAVRFGTNRMRVGREYKKALELLQTASA